MARTIRIAEATQVDVVRAARELLQESGARLREMTHSRTTFVGLAGEGSFARGGYIGVYQAMGQKAAEVLIEVYASTPRRAYWGFAGLSLLALVALLGASLGSAAFFLAALVLWPMFAVAALVYLLTFRGSAQVEDELAAELARRLAEAGLHIVGEEERLEQDIRARLEGEVKRREVAAQLAAQPKARSGTKLRKPAQAAKEKRALFGSRKER